MGALPPALVSCFVTPALVSTASISLSPVQKSLNVITESPFNAAIVLIRVRGNASPYSDAGLVAHAYGDGAPRCWGSRSRLLGLKPRGFVPKLLPTLSPMISILTTLSVQESSRSAWVFIG